VTVRLAFVAYLVFLAGVLAFCFVVAGMHR
jgi:hypothetical protein